MRQKMKRATVRIAQLENLMKSSSDEVQKELLEMREKNLALEDSAYS